VVDDNQARRSLGAIDDTSPLLSLAERAEQWLAEARREPGYMPTEVDGYQVVRAAADWAQSSGFDSTLPHMADVVKVEAFRLSGVPLDPTERAAFTAAFERLEASGFDDQLSAGRIEATRVSVVADCCAVVRDGVVRTLAELSVALVEVVDRNVGIADDGMAFRRGVRDAAERWVDDGAMSREERKVVLRWIRRLDQTPDLLPEHWLNEAIETERMLARGELQPTGQLARTAEELFDGLLALKGTRTLSEADVQALVADRLHNWLGWQLRLNKAESIDNVGAYLRVIRRRELARHADESTILVDPQTYWRFVDSIDLDSAAGLGGASDDEPKIEWAACLDQINADIMLVAQRLAGYVADFPTHHKARKRSAAMVEATAFVTAELVPDIDGALQGEYPCELVVAEFWGGLIRFTEGSDDSAEFIREHVARAMRARYWQWKRRYGAATPTGSQTRAKCEGAFARPNGAMTTQYADYRRMYRYRTGDGVSESAPFGHDGVAGLLTELFEASIEAVSGLQAEKN